MATAQAQPQDQAMAAASARTASAERTRTQVQVSAPSRREFLYYIWGASIALLLGGLAWVRLRSPEERPR